MTCETLANLQSFGDFLVYPSGCNYWFYLILLLTVGLIIAWTLFKAEEKRVGKADFISSLAVSSIVITFLGVIGTLIENSDGIPMIQSDVLLILMAINIPLILLWVFKE